MAKKRNKIEIINDILRTIKDKRGRIKQTHLMYKVNLSHKLMKSYLEELITKEMVLETKQEKNIYLLLKPRGEEFMEKLKKLTEFQETFGL
ncbi:MAG: winged helix-turn-helix domain-containing protein [archaeon]